MANFVINQTASKIQQILNKAESPDTTPTPNSQNLVESGGVKTYVDTQVSAGASITTASFAPSALEDSSDGLTATDTAVPTSAAVRNYVGNHSSTTTLTRTSALSTVDRYTAGFATIGSIPAGVYGIYGTYEYLNNQANALTGEFRITIGTETLTDAIVPNTNTSSSSSYYAFQPSTGYGGTTIQTLQLTQISGGSVVLEVKRQSTYGGSASVQVRNLTLKFVKIA